jgi:phosphomannomutase
MSPKFGTSGLRGLVCDLTQAVITDYVRAFAATCPMGTGLFVAHDLRASSPLIAAWVADAGRAAGLAVTTCGPAPTPALALAAMQAGAAAIMVTGSHIPADRNGLKFYTPSGEITKTHETAIAAALHRDWPVHAGSMCQNADIGAAYLRRYQASFAAGLAGLRIGIYGHSAVGRDLLVQLAQDLGAQVTRLGWSDEFIPLDTEAVAQSTRAQLLLWAQDQRLDAILSTDGDGDRPLMTDQHGQIIAGDILGQIAAATLAAECVVTPVSSNTGVELGGQFTHVLRCKIGSPYVIAAMQSVVGAVAGYEANGGFLLGFDAQGPSGTIPALLTRDAVLPMLAVLVASRKAGGGVAGLIAVQPQRFTASDRLEQVATAQSAAFVAHLRDDQGARAAFLAAMDAREAALDLTDGLRIICHGGIIIHLRPSGNAPELRLYIEAPSPAQAQARLQTGLVLIRTALGQSVA